jgi:hypothetical protein
MGLFNDESVNDTVKGALPEVLSEVKFATGVFAAVVVISKDAMRSEMNNNRYFITISNIFR